MKLAAWCVFVFVTVAIGTKMGFNVYYTVQHAAWKAVEMRSINADRRY